MIQAIPTQYNGVQFRSRLEAKWAAFFDALKWPWTYEPFDLNGYIPDFILEFKTPLLVEVKGQHCMAETVSKIEKGGWEKSFLVLDYVGPKQDDYCQTIGAFGEWHTERQGSVCRVGPDGSTTTSYGPLFPAGLSANEDDAALIHCPHCKHISLSSQLMAWTCLWCGDGGKEIWNERTAELDLIPTFRAAGNQTQWRAPR